MIILLATIAQGRESAISRRNENKLTGYFLSEFIQKHLNEYFGSTTNM